MSIPQQTLEVVGEAAGTLTDTQLGALLVLSLAANAVLVWQGFRYRNRMLEWMMRKGRGEE